MSEGERDPNIPDPVLKLVERINWLRARTTSPKGKVALSFFLPVLSTENFKKDIQTLSDDNMLFLFELRNEAASYLYQEIDQALIEIEVQMFGNSTEDLLLVAKTALNYLEKFKEFDLLDNKERRMFEERSRRIKHLDGDVL